MPAKGASQPGHGRALCFAWESGAFQFRNQAAEQKPIDDMLLAREAAVKGE